MSCISDPALWSIRTPPRWRLRRGPFDEIYQQRLFDLDCRRAARILQPRDASDQAVTENDDREHRRRQSTAWRASRRPGRAPALPIDCIDRIDRILVLGLHS